MLERLSPTHRNLALGVLGILVAWFAWTIRGVLNPLLLGYLAAYILHPMVVKLEDRGRSRRAAVNLIYLFGFLLALLISVGFAFESSRLVRDVVSDKNVRSQISARLVETQEFIESQPWWPEFDEEEPSEGAEPSEGGGQEVEAAELTQEGEVAPEHDFFETAVRWFRENVLAEEERAQAAGEAGLRAAGGIWRAGRSFFGGIFSVLGLFFLVPLYAYFLLFELGRIHAFVARYTPQRERERFARIGVQIGEVIANFFRGRLLVCLLKGGLLTVGLLLTGVDYAFLFGMGSGFLSLVPVVGPFFGWVCAFLVGIIGFEENPVWESLWRTGIVFWVAEMIEGYVLVPKVLGDSLGLHPVVVLFAVIAGGAALGLFGMLIALPLTAAVVILARELVLPALGRMADET